MMWTAADQPLRIRFCLVMLTVLLLGACSNTPWAVEGSPGALDTESLQKQALETIKLQETALWQSTADTYAVDVEWLKNFGDPQLDDYAHKAAVNNRDLQAQASRVAASFAGTGIAASQGRPQLDARLQHQYNKSALTGEYGSSWRPSLNLSWELDLWSRLGKQKQSAWLNAARQEHDYVAAQASLQANVARRWFELNADKLRLELLQKRLVNQQQSLLISEDQFKAGRGKAMDVFLGRSDVASQKSSILDAQSRLQDSIRAFKTLLGEYPDIDLQFDARLPDLQISVPAGLPSDLLSRRPDILSKEKAWQAAVLDSEVADKARLPSFSLTASYGASSDDLLKIKASDFAWNLINNLTLPLFQGGRLKAQAEQNLLLVESRYKEYVSQVLKAFEEVESALSAERFLAQRQMVNVEVTEAARSAYELAFEQYQSGLVSYNTLLDLESRWFSAQLDEVGLKNARLQNRINLHLALGGGFLGNEQP